MSTLSARRARVAERFAALADNRRTPRHELLKALSGLCSLGDAQRANHLLFKFYSPGGALRCVEELSSSSHKTKAGDRLALATEAASCAVSYSSMLSTVVSSEDVKALIRPCMEEEVVEDVSPLLRLRLGMQSSVLQLLAKLFRDYMHSILAVDAVDQQQQYMWQLSFLINCTTLVSLFPIIAHGVFKFKSKNQESPSQMEPELHGLTMFIKEASGQVWTHFCQQFIRDITSTLNNKPTLTTTSFLPMMPCSAFQTVFLRVRQLSDLYGTILAAKAEP
ncbi:hypothetical protein ZWY2020_001441 [Hordeum vulgare]|nr:hypothetical protein ZWY2020_001441 [Hordeum vulgare]